MARGISFRHVRKQRKLFTGYRKDSYGTAQLQIIRNLRRRKRGGSVLVATLLIGVAALSLATLCLSTSTAMFGEFFELSGTIGRENAAREAMFISRAYFVSHLSPEYEYGEQLGAQAANPRPIAEIPRSVFEPISAKYPDAIIEGIIIDLNYDVSFLSEARRLGIPHGVPSLITMTKAGGDRKTYRARRYELRTKVTFINRLRGSYSVRQGLLVLVDDDAARSYVIDLYVEK